MIIFKSGHASGVSLRRIKGHIPVKYKYKLFKARFQAMANNSTWYQRPVVRLENLKRPDWSFKGKVEMVYMKI